MNLCIETLTTLPELEQINTPPWLRDPSSVTARLRAHGALQVDCLAEKEAAAVPYAWLREVVLSVNDHPLVWAVTLVPAKTLQAFPVLRSLGCQSLGDFLFSEPAWCRSMMRFRDFSSILGVLPAQYQHLSWLPVLRQSRFSQGQYWLDLFELFKEGA